MEPDQLGLPVRKNENRIRIARIEGEIDMKNIVLIGMPGAGKSTIGVILAKLLGYSFIDSDILIQEQENRLLHEIITQEGVDGFLAIENHVNASIHVKNAVIATGGSVIYGQEAMKHLKEIATIVYLQLPYEQLEARLSNIKGRGVALRDGQTLRDLYEERTVLYENYADIVIDEGGLSVEETISKVMEALGQGI